MKKIILLLPILLTLSEAIFSQTSPIWDVGTKWTYELFNPPHSTSYVTNEITGTDTIDGLLLYSVKSEPTFTGITYFYFDDDKVYDWEFGVHICDDLENFVYQLRCFENGDISYNFQEYPCDSIWFTSQTQDFSASSTIKVSPNPTNGMIEIDGIDGEVFYELLRYLVYSSTKT